MDFMQSIIAILTLLIILISLIAYILRSRKLDANEILRIFLQGAVSPPNENIKENPHDIEKALLTLFKNMTTTFYLFNILIAHNGPLPEKDAYKIVGNYLSLKNKNISEAALKASVRLLMASNLVAMDIEEGYKPTPLGKELYQKLINDV